MLRYLLVGCFSSLTINCRHSRRRQVHAHTHTHTTFLRKSSTQHLLDQRKEDRARPQRFGWVSTVFCRQGHDSLWSAARHASRVTHHFPFPQRGRVLYPVLAAGQFCHAVRIGSKSPIRKQLPSKNLIFFPRTGRGDTVLKMSRSFDINP